eukprot:448709-Pleurochrysis_carterae.AAC.1
MAPDPFARAGHIVGAVEVGLQLRQLAKAGVEGGELGVRRERRSVAAGFGHQLVLVEHLPQMEIA